MGVACSLSRKHKLLISIALFTVTTLTSK